MNVLDYRPFGKTIAVNLNPKDWKRAFLGTFVLTRELSSSESHPFLKGPAPWLDPDSRPVYCVSVSFAGEIQGVIDPYEDSVGVADHFLLVPRQA